MAASLTKRLYAVVTGANKGIGFETVRQLASKGIGVVLAARDEQRGLEALLKLQQIGLSDHVFFHQLDVSDPASITSFADFVKTQFGKLDILVNNAGIMGAIVDFHALNANPDAKGHRHPTNPSEVFIETYELAEECIRTNYYGAKRMADSLIPLLQLSDSPRIVNVSSSAGKSGNIQNRWAKGVVTDVNNLTEERVDELVHEFLKDFREGSSETKGWPPRVSAYVVSKTALNAYTRILAKRYPSFCINCVCPGFVKTDMNNYTGVSSLEDGASHLVRLALLPNGGPSGLFFVQQQVSPF